MKRKRWNVQSHSKKDAATLQKMNTRPDIIWWERICARGLKFDITIKWYMYKSKSVVENETYKILYDFDIQTDLRNLGHKTRPSVDKPERKCRLVDFAVPVDHRVKIKETEKVDK